MNDINLLDRDENTPVRGIPSRRFNDVTDEKQLDDDEDDESGTQAGAAGQQCQNTCNSASRTYCPEHCRNTFAQDLRGTAGSTGETGITNPACRQLNGQLPVQTPVSIYIDDGGDTDDEDNNGMISATCVQECTATPGCDPVRVCVDRFRAPLEDDGDDDEGRTRMSAGPVMVNNENIVIPATHFIFGNHLTRGYTYFDDSNGGTRAVPPTDDAFGSVDDDYFCDVYGIGDQVATNGKQGTWVAECPVGFCIAPIDYQPDDNYYFKDLDTLPDNYFCPKSMFPDNPSASDIRRICNRPLPQRVVGTDDPDAAYAYDQLPFTICPLGHPDRIGLIPVDQLTYIPGNSGFPYRVMGHKTGEAVGALGSYCMPNKLSKTPRYYYNITVTITDTSPGADPATATEVLVMTPQIDAQSGGSTTTFYALSSDSTIYAKLLGLEAADNVIAPDLDATVMLCNATADGGPGTPDIPYRMAGDLSVSEAAQTSPWLTAASGKSYFWDSSVKFRDGTSGAGPVVINNNDFLGLLPLPENLMSMPGAYDQRDVDADPSIDPTTLGIKKGSWWYMLTGEQQAWLGEGLGQLGMKPEIYGNSAAAEQVCLSGFCEWVPGIEGQRYTMQRRYYDSGLNSLTDPRLSTTRIAKESGNDGTDERFVRDEVINVNTPAQVNGRLHDFYFLDDPESLKQELVRFGHLPASFYSDSAGSGKTSDGRDQASLPTMFIQANVLLSQDPSFSTDGVFERFELSFANTVLLDADSDLQDGQFVDDPVPICAVGEFSTSGQLTIAAENLGDENADFTVSAQCDGSVSAGASQTRNLAPGQVVQFTIVLSHTGAALPETPYFPDGGNSTTNGTAESAIPADAYDFTCIVYLGTPVFPNPELYHYDSVELDNCKLAAGGDTDTTASVPPGTNLCTSFGVACPAVGEGDAGPTDQEVERTFYAALMVFLIVAVLLLIIVAVILAYRVTTSYRSRKEAELTLTTGF